MPAKSKAQQKFMGLVHAFQKGELDPEDVSKDVEDAADSMKKKDVKDFATTKHKGLPDKVKENINMKHMKLKDALKYEGTIFDDEPKLSEEQKTQFLEAIGNFNEFNGSIYREHDLKEVAKKLGKLAELAESYVLSEQDDWFDNVSVKRDMKSIKESVKLFEKSSKEMGQLQQRLESCYESVATGLNKYFEMKKSEIVETDEIKEGRMKDLAMSIEDAFANEKDPKKVAQVVAKEMNLKVSDVMKYVKQMQGKSMREGLTEGKMKELMMTIDDAFETERDPKKVAILVAKDIGLKVTDVLGFVKQRYADLKKQGQFK